MKERTPEQLKGQIRSFAGKRSLQSQEVLQMFLLERVLDRLSKSKYKDNFILKGGLLISSMTRNRRKNNHGYGYYSNWNQYGGDGN